MGAVLSGLAVQGRAGWRGGLLVGAGIAFAAASFIALAAGTASWPPIAPALAFLLAPMIAAVLFLPLGLFCAGIGWWLSRGRLSQMALVRLTMVASPGEADIVCSLLRSFNVECSHRPIVSVEELQGWTEVRVWRDELERASEILGGGREA